MKMFRHQNVTEDAEAQLGPEIGKRGDEMAFEPLGIKNARAAIGAGRQIMKVIAAVIAKGL